MERGLIFLPQDEAARAEFKEIIGELVEQQGQRLLGWRKVPQCPDEADIGPLGARGRNRGSRCCSSVPRRERIRKLSNDNCL